MTMPVQTKIGPRPGAGESAGDVELELSVAGREIAGAYVSFAALDLEAIARTIRRVPAAWTSGLRSHASAA